MDLLMPFVHAFLSHTYSIVSHARPIKVSKAVLVRAKAAACVTTAQCRSIYHAMPRQGREKQVQSGFPLSSEYRCRGGRPSPQTAHTSGTEARQCREISHRRVLAAPPGPVSQIDTGASPPQPTRTNTNTGQKCITGAHPTTRPSQAAVPGRTPPGP